MSIFRSFLAATLAVLAFNVFAAVDANKASQAELESVKGIGPGLSTRILDARKTASFKDWTDLVDRVSGIGPGNAARFSQAGLTVGGQGYALAADAAKPAKGKSAKSEKGERSEKSDKAAKPAAARKGE